MFDLISRIHSIVEISPYRVTWFQADSSCFQICFHLSCFTFQLIIQSFIQWFDSIVYILCSPSSIQWFFVVEKSVNFIHILTPPDMSLFFYLLYGFIRCYFSFLICFLFSTLDSTPSDFQCYKEGHQRMITSCEWHFSFILSFYLWIWFIFPFHF